MTPFTRLQGIAAPLPIANVDTDKIIAGRYLKTVSREGLGHALFESLRRDAAGALIPNFILNRPAYAHARFLVALENFGCGSSREHAPWALMDFGIRCIVAVSFAEIFYTNCLKNGILPVCLPRHQVDELLLIVSVPEQAEVEVDLETQTLMAGQMVWQFDIAASAKRRLLEGRDDIAMTLTHEQAIEAFEAAHRNAELSRPVAFLCN
jgi:3-isopropylmalate/(R)-2-methylmalate dehydratase small subunit